MADGIAAAGQAGIDLPQGDLVADEDGGLETRATRSLQIKPRGVGVQAAREHALAREVVVFGAVDDRAGGDISQTYAL